MDYISLVKIISVRALFFVSFKFICIISEIIFQDSFLNRVLIAIEQKTTLRNGFYEIIRASRYFDGLSDSPCQIEIFLNKLINLYNNRVELFFSFFSSGRVVVKILKIY